jgi:hypothetical protein
MQANKWSFPLNALRWRPSEYNLLSGNKRLSILLLIIAINLNILRDESESEYIFRKELLKDNCILLYIFNFPIIQNGSN